MNELDKKEYFDTIRCEVCGKVGDRVEGAACPEDWWYAEVYDEEEPDEEELITTVCSTRCMGIFFRPGPGIGIYSGY